MARRTSAANARFWSVHLRRLVIFFFLLLICVEVFVTAMAVIRPDLLPWVGIEFDFIRLSHLGQSLVLADLFIELTLMLVPVWYLQRLLELWSNGLLLTNAAARLMKRIGLSALVVTAVLMVYLPLSTLVLNVLEQRTVLEPGFELELIPIIAGAVLYIAGLVMEEAARLAEEAELVI